MALVTGLTAVSAVCFPGKCRERPNEFFFWLLLVVAGPTAFSSAPIFSFLRLLRAGHRPKVFPHRDLGFDQQGIRRDEADALFVLRWRARLHWNRRHVWPTPPDRSTFNNSRSFQFAPQFQTGRSRLCSSASLCSRGIWPLHTWAPTGHVAAPTAGSMLARRHRDEARRIRRAARGDESVSGQDFTSGVNGSPSLPSSGSSTRRLWRLRQRDLKFVIGYSSVSHMGFVLLGLATAQCARRRRRSSANVFAWRYCRAALRRGRRMIYRRTHTRDLDELSAMGSGPDAALRRVRLRHRLRGVDGHSRVQRICRGNHHPAWRVENISDSRFGSPAPVWCWSRPSPCARLKKTFFGDDRTARHGQVVSGPNDSAHARGETGRRACSFSPPSPLGFIRNCCSIESCRPWKRCDFYSDELSRTAPARRAGSHRRRDALCWS